MKRWIVPVLVALLAHLLLFSVDPRWTRPVRQPPRSPALELSLVAPPPQPAAARPRPATPAVAPKAPTPTRPKPPKPEPVRPAPTPTPVPAPQPPAAPVPVPAQESPAADETAAPAPSQAPPPLSAAPADSGAAEEPVQASVPLYDRNPPPEYPAAARRRNLEGTVLLEVLVDREGKAAEVKLLTSSGHGLLDRSALESVRRWRFRPATRGGRPEPMWVQVPVRFKLQ